MFYNTYIRNTRASFMLKCIKFIRNTAGITLRVRNVAKGLLCLMHLLLGLKLPGLGVVENSGNVVYMFVFTLMAFSIQYSSIQFKYKHTFNF